MSWPEVKLREFSTLITKGTTPTTMGYPFIERGVNFVKAEAVTTNGRIEKDKLTFISDEAHQKLKRSQLKGGDILFSMAGMVIGKTCVFPAELEPANTNQALGIIRLDTTKADPWFVHYFIKNPTFNLYINNLVGQSAQPNLNLAEIGNLPIRLPEIKTQKKIVQILKSLDDKIELNNQINETLESIAKTIFKEWFIDFGPVKAKAEGKKPFGMDAETASLFPDSFENSELGMIPKGWQTATLGSICSLEYGKALKEENRVDGPVDVWGSNSVVGTHNVEFVKGPGIVIGRKGNAGAVSWAFKNFWPIDTAFYVVPKQELSLEYLFDVFQNINFKNLNSDSAVPGLNRDQALSVIVSIPKKPEIIEKYTHLRKHFNALIRSNLDEIVTVRTTRDLLLPKLISGELSLNEASGD